MDTVKSARLNRWRADNYFIRVSILIGDIYSFIFIHFLKSLEYYFHFIDSKKVTRRGGALKEKYFFDFGYTKEDYEFIREIYHNNKYTDETLLKKFKEISKKIQPAFIFNVLQRKIFCRKWRTIFQSDKNH